MKPLTNKKIFGNWTALLLTTSRKGEIDYSRLSDELDVLIASHPNGIYSNGTAGEFYTQTEDEFDRINYLLSEKCEKEGVPYQIGVSHMSPQISLDRLKRIRHLSPGAVQVILPDWFPVTIEEAIVFLLRMEQEAEGIPMVLYNPPHAKVTLRPEDWSILKKNVPSLTGLKVSDNIADGGWYRRMNANKEGLSIFIPGHRLATGIISGAHGAYSNIACLNPFVAQKWYDKMKNDMPTALELESRIVQFMEKLIAPFITEQHYSNQACDRFMAMLGGWFNVGENLRWPYKSIPKEYVNKIIPDARKIIPEFFEK